MPINKILICAHKPSSFPKDELYIPVQGGASLHDSFGILKDDEGDNISNKNPFYSELTALYFGYKNLDYDYLGLVHYRRYFKGKEKLTVDGKTKGILNSDELNKLLEKNDLILPKKRHYYIFNLYNHYKKTMYVEPLDMTGEIIKEKYPEYYQEFLKLKKRRSMHAFNMFVGSKKFTEGYLNWLFDILFELEKRVDVSSYTDFHKRFYGRISERLLDIYVRVNKIKYAERKVVYLGKMNKFKKVYHFLLSFITGKKYDQSF